MANILQITFSNVFSFKILLSVFLPVTPFSLCSRHGIIMKFSGVITNNRNDAYAKVQGQRSKVKVTEVKTQISRFGTITPILISHMVMKWYTKLDIVWEQCPIDLQGHLSNFKVTRLKQSLILIQLGHFRTVSPVWIHRWLWNDA